MSKLFRTPSIPVQIAQGVHLILTEPSSELLLPEFLWNAAAHAGCVPADGKALELNASAGPKVLRNQDALAKLRASGADEANLKRDANLRKQQDPRAPAGDHPPVDEQDAALAESLPPLLQEVDAEENTIAQRLQPYLETLVTRGEEADFLVSTGRPRISAVRREASAEQPNFPDITPQDVVDAWDQFNEHRGTEPA